MILTKLKEYAETRLNLPPEMYGETKVRWLLDLDETGSMKPVPLGADSKTTQRGIPKTLPMLPKKRASGIQPNLLADTGEYVLGIPKEGSKPERVAKCHQQFKDLIRKCADTTQDHAVQTILKFLENWDPLHAQLPQNFDPSDVVTFRIGTRIPADANPKNQAIQEFWARYTAGGNEEESSLPVMMCLVTGQETQVVKRLPEPLKGIPGGQPSGTSLVSANADAFTSYGLKNSLTSPISRSAAEKFGKALNHLLQDEKSHLRVGSSVFVFWTRDPEEFDLWSLLDKPKAEDAQNLLKSIFKGEKNYSIQGHENEFYALSLTANNARAVVRNWLQTTVPQVQQHLQKWFQDQQIVDPYGQPSKPFGIYALAASAYRDPNKEMQSRIPASLIQSALSGTALPEDLLVKLNQRIGIEGEIFHARAALLKLFLLSYLRRNHRPMPNLETFSPQPDLDPPDQSAFQCGRFFAQLEIIQREAQGKGLNTTLVDRYYTAASTTPKKVLGDLIAKAQSHLAKIRKERKGVYEALEQRLEEISLCLDPAVIPNSLTMQQQSLFGLGYYHQRAENRRRAKESAEAKKSQHENESPGKLNND
ncbi:MAG: type I-C CRISPR-associated protein Cas8c/Csd1 [Cyanobacteriota bacterium]|nr:type I-C CRISPR-associated protein Cas8c/Csd1 [Cyanobacteriota bacterium]